MAGKKTGLYLSPIAEEIVNKIMQQYGYTKISNCINFIVLEYDKLTKKKKEVVKTEPQQENNGRPQVDFTGWFIEADKQQ